MVNPKMVIYDVIMVAYVLIGISIFVPPLLLSINNYDPNFLGISNSILDFFHKFCHQLASRSIFFGDIKMPVCARCASIYVATALGLIYFRFKGFGVKEFKLDWVLLGLLFVPTGLDGVSQMLGMRESTNLLRLVAGFPYGIGWAYMIAWGLPFVYATLSLLLGAVTLSKKRVMDDLKRMKAMLWPPI
jgi:uncharacterized membrane protein